MTKIVVGTYNLYQRSDDEKADDALDEFGDRIDIAGLQEYGGPVRRKSLDELYGLDYFKPKDVPTAPPIIWDRNRFDLHEGIAPIVATGRRVGAAPGKRAVLDDYHASIVVLWDSKADKEIVVGNIHTPAHVEFWPGPRRSMYREALLNTVKEMELFRNRPAFLVGDFNWDLRKPGCLPDKLLNPKGLSVCWDYHSPKVGTHGKRVIDGIYSNLHRSNVDGAYVLAGFDVGDHKPAVAVYEI